MTRTEFLNAYCDYEKQQRGSVAATEEFKAHTRDRDQAGVIWRKSKTRLQMLTRDEWTKQHAKERAK